MLTDHYYMLQKRIEKISDLLSNGTETILGWFDQSRLYADSLLYLNELTAAARGIEACCTGDADRELASGVRELIRTYNSLSTYIQGNVSGIFQENNAAQKDKLNRSTREQIHKVQLAVQARAKSIMMLTGNIQEYALRDLVYAVNITHKMKAVKILDYGMTLQKQGIVEDEIEHGDFQLSLRKIQFDGITTENGEDDIMPAYTGNIYHDIYTEEQLPEKQYDMVWLMNRYDGGNAEQICREISVVGNNTRYVLINVLAPVQDSDKNEILLHTLSEMGYCATVQHDDILFFLLDCHPQKYQGKVGMYVVTHKAFRPPEDPMYIPIHAGRKGKDDLGYQGDDTGDNISVLNPYINEMTAAYWIWKNDKEHDYLGINHYRRYFNWRGLSDAHDLADEETILENMKDYDVIVSEPLFFYPMSIGYQLREMFGHGKAIDVAFDVTRKAIRKYQPEYEKCFDEVMDGHNFICCNIFVTSREIYGAYCSWLFGFLPEAVDNWMKECPEEEQEKSPRAMGFMTERLLSVWLMGQKLRVGVINGMATMKYCLPE